MLQQELTSCAPDLGKVFGYGLLHCAKDNQNFVCEVISTALETVAEKQGIKKAFGTILCEELNTRYLELLQVRHWLQLYVKLATKLPNRSWQTLLNFLNIGRSGVSFIFTIFFYLLTVRNLLSVHLGKREGSGVEKYKRVGICSGYLIHSFAPIPGETYFLFFKDFVT